MGGKGKKKNREVLRKGKKKDREDSIKGLRREIDERSYYLQAVGESTDGDSSALLQKALQIPDISPLQGWDSLTKRLHFGESRRGVTYYVPPPDLLTEPYPPSQN